MEDNFLQFIFKTESERKKAIYFLLALTLSIIISCKIYGRLIGTFEIIPLTEYKIIVSDFLLSGRFVVALTILIAVYKLFYSFGDFFLYKWLAKQSDKLYDFFKYKVKPDDIKEEMKTSNFLQRLANWAINHFKQLSVIDIEKDGIKPGINFFRLLHYFRKLNDDNDKETIDTTLAYYPISITLQILLLFDTVVIDHFKFSTTNIVFVNLATVLILVFLFIVYFVNIFIDLKQDKILKALEQLATEKNKQQS